MSDEPIMTETQVKTKTVSKAQIALALAFLGVSAVAAAAALTTMSSDGKKGAPKCTDTDVSTVNAGNMPLATYQYANLGQKGIATGLGSNGVQMMGEDKCWSGTRILEYFCNAKKNIVSWNSYNCPTGTNCLNGACVGSSLPDLTITDISLTPNVNGTSTTNIVVTLKNNGNAPALSFGVNLYKKNPDGTYINIVWPEIAGTPNGVPKWGSAAVGSGDTATYSIQVDSYSLMGMLALSSEADPNNQVQESNELNNYLEIDYTEYTLPDEGPTSTLIGLVPMYYPVFSYVNADTVLVNGIENDIFSFNVHGTNNGDVALKQLKFTIDVVDNVGTQNPGIKLTGFKLYRGDIDITSSVEFRKVAVLGGDFFVTTGIGMPFYIVWKTDKEEVIAGGMTNTYVIKTTIGGFNNNEDDDFVRVRLDNDDVKEIDKSKNINYLISIANFQSILGLSNSSANNIVFDVATLIWSDRSSPVHSAAVGNPPVSSGDWFNGYYAKNLPTKYSMLIK